MSVAASASDAAANNFSKTRLRCGSARWGNCLTNPSDWTKRREQKALRMDALKDFQGILLLYGFFESIWPEVFELIREMFGAPLPFMRWSFRADLGHDLLKSKSFKGWKWVLRELDQPYQKNYVLKNTVILVTSATQFNHLSHLLFLGFLFPVTSAWYRGIMTYLQLKAWWGRMVLLGVIRSPSQNAVCQSTLSWFLPPENWYKHQMNGFWM